MPSLAAAAGALGGGDVAGLGDPLLVDGNGERLTGVEGKYWVPADEEEAKESGGKDGRPPLFRRYKVRGALLHPYRLLVSIRLIVVVLFFAWLVQHHKTGFWVMSVIGDIWFGFSWVLYQLPKYSPIKTIPNLTDLRQQYDLPDGNSKLPGIDIFVTTADPIDEPILYTMNTILSILAVDYPIDQGSLIVYEALVQVAKFDKLWVPFCRKHCIEPRAPENYFESEAQPYIGRAVEEFLHDRQFVRKEYNEFKLCLNTLPSIIYNRSNIYNIVNCKLGDPRATWMADGTQWPGTWIDPTENHMKGHHAGIVQIILEHLSHGRQPSTLVKNNPINFKDIDTNIPMLVYVSREKNPTNDHNKKAGALNAQLRLSALLSNAPFMT